MNKNAEDVPLNRYVTSSIHTGYRVGLSPLRTARSVFELHNETVNVWTHMVPLVMGLHILAQTHVPLCEWDLDAFVTHLSVFGSMVVAPATSCFTHLFWMAEHPSLRYIWAFDFVGVVVAVVTGGLGAFWFVLRGSPVARGFSVTMYLVLAYILMTKAVREHIRHTDTIPLYPRESFPEFRLPTVWLVLLGWIVPLTIGAMMEQAGPVRDAVMDAWVCPMCVVVGGAFLVNEFPESMAPKGTFDIFGSSHQIWHACTGYCMVVWSAAVWKMHENAH